VGAKFAFLPKENEQNFKDQAAEIGLKRTFLVVKYS